MNTDEDLEKIIFTAQKSYKQKLKKLNESIRNSVIDIEKDPLLLTLREDSSTEAFVPLRLKELYEDRTTKDLIEGLKKELNQALTEYYIEYNQRHKLEKILENEKIEKNEAHEETGILKLSIKELEKNLENLRVKYENGIKIKQNEAKDYKFEYHKNKSIIDELEKQIKIKNEENSKISEIFDRERAERIQKEEILTDLKRENEEYKRKLQFIENDHNELSIKFRDANNEIDFLNSELYKINEERTEIEESTLLFKKSLSLEKEKEVSSFKGQVNDIKKKFSNKLSEVKEELNKKNFDLDSYKANLAELEKILGESQKQFSKEKNELIELLESSKTEFKGTIAKMIKKHENDILIKTNKYEADIEELKSFYKTVIKSQLNEFEARTSAFLQREKEKDDHIMNLAKQTSQNFIETKTHQLILSEKLEESKILNQKMLAQAEYEMSVK